MPKIIPEAVKVRAVALLVELKNAEQAAAQVMREFPGQSVTGMSVARWGKGLKVKVRPGRPVGTPGSTDKRGSSPKTSPLRARVLELWADGQGMPQAEIARTVGTTRQNVFNLINRK